MEEILFVQGTDPRADRRFVAALGVDYPKRKIVEATPEVARRLILTRDYYRVCIGAVVVSQKDALAHLTGVTKVDRAQIREQKKARA